MHAFHSHNADLSPRYEGQAKVSPATSRGHQMLQYFLSLMQVGDLQTQKGFVSYLHQYNVLVLSLIAVAFEIERTSSLKARMLFVEAYPRKGGGVFNDAQPFKHR